MRGSKTGETQALLCPSAQPGISESAIFGVVGGSVDDPRVQYLDKPLPVTDEVLQLAAPVRPTEVFRFAAACEENGCQHFRDASCSLGAKTVQLLPAVVATLPACAIRPRCRWFREQGKEACARCPVIVTENYVPTPEQRLAADPRVSVPASNEGVQ